MANHRLSVCLFKHSSNFQDPVAEGCNPETFPSILQHYAGTKSKQTCTSCQEILLKLRTYLRNLDTTKRQ